MPRNPVSVPASTQDWQEDTEELNRVMSVIRDQPMNDAGNAMRLKALHGDDMCYVAENKTWMTWNGKVWEDSPARANTFAVRVSEAINEHAATIPDPKTAAKWRSFAVSSGNDSKITAMLRQAAALEGMTMSPSRFDADPALLTAGNGTIILGHYDARLRDSSREDYCRTFVHTDYDPDATSVYWSRFLKKFVPDIEVQDYLQRLVGYSLYGANNDRKLIFLHGPTSTGKTTFLKLITRVLGKGTAGPILLTLFREKGQDAPRPDMLLAMSRRFVHAAEASADWKLHADTIKRLTGADQLSARGMFSNKFTESTASFTPWIATNAFPSIEHVDTALHRRMVVVPFMEAVSDLDDDPEFTINFPADQLPGVLRWMVDGWTQYREHGLRDMPPSVRKATERLLSSLSSIDTWVADRCEVGADLKCPATELFMDFQEWEHDEAIPERERYTQTAFGRALDDRGYLTPGHPERIGPRSEGRKVRMRHGLNLCYKSGIS